MRNPYARIEKHCNRLASSTIPGIALGSESRKLNFESSSGKSHTSPRINRAPRITPTRYGDNKYLKSKKTGLRSWDPRGSLWGISDIILMSAPCFVGNINKWVDLSHGEDITRQMWITSGSCLISHNTKGRRWTVENHVTG